MTKDERIAAYHALITAKPEEYRPVVFKAMSAGRFMDRNDRDEKDKFFRAVNEACNGNPALTDYILSDEVKRLAHIVNRRVKGTRSDGSE